RHPEAGHDRARRAPRRRGADALDGARRDRDRGPRKQRGEGGGNRERNDGEHLPACSAARGRHALGTKLVRRKRVTGVLLIAFISCKPTPPPAAKQAAPGPRTRATVVTIQTTIQPGNKTTSHTLVIANGRARSSDELDSWRLFDLANGRVTFVSDVEKTYRTVPLAQL